MTRLPFIAVSMLFAMIALLSGCVAGGGSYLSEDVAGTVTDSGGNPISGARVIAMERATSEKFSTTTNADGSYTLTLPKGAYDIAVDDGQAYATYFTGPVISDGEEEIELDVTFDVVDTFVDTIDGTITHETVTDLTGYVVEFISNVVPEYDDRILATVELDETGSFSANIEGEVVMDLNVYDPDGKLVEFIDIAKLPGPCYVEFHVGTEDTNWYRHDEEYGDHQHDDLDIDYKSLVYPAHTNDAFNLDISHGSDYLENGEYRYEYKLTSGELGVSGGHMRITEDTWPGFEDRSAMGFWMSVYPHNRDNLEFDIEVKDDGSFWYDYKIHVYGQCRSGIPEAEDAHFEFEDKTKDTYTLHISMPKYSWHTVNYNSDDPTLKEIKLWVNGPGGEE